MEGLENQLDGVHVGDIILLQSPELEVSGYVVDFSSKQVKLSHEHPFFNSSHKAWARHRTSLSVGDRAYRLSFFQSYEVLKQDNPQKKPE